MSDPLGTMADPPSHTRNERAMREQSRVESFRYDGWSAIMKSFRKMGLMDEETLPPGSTSWKQLMASLNVQPSLVSVPSADIKPINQEAAGHMCHMPLV